MRSKTYVENGDANDECAEATDDAPLGFSPLVRSGAVRASHAAHAGEFSYAARPSRAVTRLCPLNIPWEYEVTQGEEHITSQLWVYLWVQKQRPRVCFVFMMRAVTVTC